MTPEQKSHLQYQILDIAHPSMLFIESGTEPGDFPTDADRLRWWAEPADADSVRGIIALGGQPLEGEDEFWDRSIAEMVREALWLHPELAAPVEEHLLSELSELAQKRPNRSAVLLCLAEIQGMKGTRYDIPAKASFLLDQLSSISEEEATSLAELLARNRSPERDERLRTLRERIPAEWTETHEEIYVSLTYPTS
jgi:hypothetical protein